MSVAILVLSSTWPALASVVSERPSRDTIEVLGWDERTERIYYLVSAPFPSKPGHPDSLRHLRYYSTADSTDRQPHTLMASADSQPEKMDRLRGLAKEIMKRGRRMPVADLRKGVTVTRTNERAFEGDDYIMNIADYRIDFGRLAGSWTSFVDSDNLHGLRVARIHLVPRRGLGVAVLENPGPPRYQFARVVLIADRPVPALLNDFTQTP